MSYCSQRRWKKTFGKKGLFGGNIKSQKEIRELNRSIVEHEKKTFKVFEKDFDQELKQLRV